jgi:hypothetical protein
MFRHDETSEHDVGHRLMSLHDFISHSPGVEVASGARLSQCTHWQRFQMLYRWGPAFPDWTFGFKQSSLTLIARVLRHLTLQHFQVSIAFTAGYCPLDLSVSGQPVTQEHSSKFFLVAPGISSCVTWRTLAAGRRSRIDACETFRAFRAFRACRCPVRSGRVGVPCVSLPHSLLGTRLSRTFGVRRAETPIPVSSRRGMLRWVCFSAVGNWDSASVGFTLRPGLAVPHPSYLRIEPL